MALKHGWNVGLNEGDDGARVIIHKMKLIWFEWRCRADTFARREENVPKHLNKNDK